MRADLRAQPMNRRTNLFFLLPLLAALVVFFITQHLVFTAVAFVVGYLLMEGLRFTLLPPHLHRAARQYQRGNLEEALELTEQSIAARPERWESHYLRALIKFNSADLKGAELSARQTIDLNPEEAAAHLILGQIAFAQGQYADARRSFLEALQNGGKLGVHQYHAGAAAYRADDCEETIPRLELALRLGIDNPQLMLLAKFYLADCLQRTGETDAAEEYFSQLPDHSRELESLRRDLHIVPDYPERTALSNDVQTIARYVPADPLSENTSD